MGEFYQYLCAFFVSWWAIVPGGVFLGIDDAIIKWFPDAKVKLDKLQEKYRKRVEVAVLVLGVFYAGFSAWQSAYNEVQSLTGQRVDFRDLNADQTTCLKKAFSDKRSDFPLILVSAVAGVEPEYYGQAFIKAFQEAGLNVLPSNGAVPVSGHEDDTGIIIGFADPLHPSKTATEFETLFTSCGFKVSTEPFENQGYSVDFDLFIAPAN